MEINWKHKNDAVPSLKWCTRHVNRNCNGNSSPKVDLCYVSTTRGKKLPNNKRNRGVTSVK